MAGGAARRAHADELGSVQLVTDGAGAVAGGGGYEPWGAAQPGTTGLGASASAGEPGHAERGAVSLRARDGAAATGRRQ